MILPRCCRFLTLPYRNMYTHNPPCRIDRRSSTPLTVVQLPSAGLEVFLYFARCLFESREVPFTSPQTLPNVHDMGLLTIIRKNRRKEREMRVLFL